MRKLLEQWDKHLDEDIQEKLTPPVTPGGFNVKPPLESDVPAHIVIALLQEILAELKTLTYHSTPARGPIETGLEKALATTIQEALNRRRNKK